MWSTKACRFLLRPSMKVIHDNAGLNFLSKLDVYTCQDFAWIAWLSNPKLQYCLSCAETFSLRSSLKTHLGWQNVQWTRFSFKSSILKQSASISKSWESMDLASKQEKNAQVCYQDRQEWIFAAAWSSAASLPLGPMMPNPIGQLLTLPQGIVICSQMKFVLTHSIVCIPLANMLTILSMLIASMDRYCATWCRLLLREAFPEGSDTCSFHRTSMVGAKSLSKILLLEDTWGRLASPAMQVREMSRLL